MGDLKSSSTIAGVGSAKLLDSDDVTSQKRKSTVGEDGPKKDIKFVFMPKYQMAD